LRASFVEYNSALRRARIFFRLLALAAAAIAVPATADAYTACNRIMVEDIGKATFEVISRAGRTGARDYWCAAEDCALSHGFA